MQKISQKSKKFFNCAMLGIYILFLASAVFHKHNIDINLRIEFVNHNSSSNTSDPFLDGQANCVLANFLQSQIYDSGIVSRFLFIIPDYKNFTPVNFSLDIFPPLLETIKLRGPPSLYS